MKLFERAGDDDGLSFEGIGGFGFGRGGIDAGGAHVVDDFNVLFRHAGSRKYFVP